MKGCSHCHLLAERALYIPVVPAELLGEIDENAGRRPQPGGEGVDGCSGEGFVAPNLRQPAPQGHRERGGLGIANRE